MTASVEACACMGEDALVLSPHYCLYEGNYRSAAAITDIMSRSEVEQLNIEGAVVKLGPKLACVDLRIFSTTNALIPSGRGTFYIPSDRTAAPAS